MKSACFPGLKLKCDELLLSFSFHIQLAPLLEGRQPQHLAPVPDPQRAEDCGRAVQVDPMEPTLKAPEAKRLKLKYDELLSNFASNFNLRHYTAAKYVYNTQVGGCRLTQY
jgi:hypothetical protein